MFVNKCMYGNEQTSMKKIKKQSGFTIIELIITLFIAAAFLATGFQLYTVIIKDGGETSAQFRASNIVYEYLQRFKPDLMGVNGSCIAKDLIPEREINNTTNPGSNLQNAKISVKITCPNHDQTPNIHKIQVDLKYGNPQQTVSNATFVNPTGTCPTPNFIRVPGSATYNTVDFCVMKYEAKKVDSVPTSQPNLQPWVNITQVNAKINSNKTCIGCHLISEEEWLTIAQNILNVDSNWSGGTVGNGHIFSGHNDNDPSKGLVASNNNEKGYCGTISDVLDSDNEPCGPIQTDIMNNQRRTLKLSNDEVIWDFAGNVAEWTSGQATTGQPGITADAYNTTQKEWKDNTIDGNLTINPAPKYANNSAINWSSNNGIGKLISNSNESATLRAFIRSGSYISNNYAGIFALTIYYTPTFDAINIGFRVAK